MGNRRLVVQGFGPKLSTLNISLEEQGISSFDLNGQFFRYLDGQPCSRDLKIEKLHTVLVVPLLQGTFVFLRHTITMVTAKSRFWVVSGSSSVHYKSRIRITAEVGN